MGVVDCSVSRTRRAMAYRGLHNWQGATEDLKEAIKLSPKDREVRDLLKKTKDAAAEARYCTFCFGYFFRLANRQSSSLAFFRGFQQSIGRSPSAGILD